MKKPVIIVLIAIAIILIIFVLIGKNKLQNAQQSEYPFETISMDEAKEIFETPGDYIILDVRRPDEYGAGHIPGAINYANENLVTERPEVLPDLDQRIYVYCRTGRRSKIAAATLVDMGYTNICEIGGIVDWTGEIEI